MLSVYTVGVYEALSRPKAMTKWVCVIFRICNGKWFCAGQEVSLVQIFLCPFFKIYGLVFSLHKGLF